MKNSYFVEIVNREVSAVPCAWNRRFFSLDAPSLEDARSVAKMFATENCKISVTKNVFSENQGEFLNAKD